MFTVIGLTEDGRQASVSWSEPDARRRSRDLDASRGLEGEAIVRRAIMDEAVGREFAATVTGPFLRANLDDASVTLVHLGSYFRPGMRVEGEVPRVAYLLAFDPGRLQDRATSERCGAVLSEDLSEATDCDDVRVEKPCRGM